MISSPFGLNATFEMPISVGIYSIFVYASNYDTVSGTEVRVQVVEATLEVIIVANVTVIFVGDTVLLNATASIPDNENTNIPPITLTSIEWDQLSGFNTPLSDPFSLETTFTSVAVGEAVYQLTIEDILGRVATGTILITTADPMPPASGSPVSPDTNCTLAGGVCTVSEPYCAFIGGVEAAFNCTSETSSDPSLPGFGSTFCCILVNGTIPGSPTPGPIPSQPPDYNRPISPAPPPFQPKPPRARPLIPPNPNNPNNTTPIISDFFQMILDNILISEPISTNVLIAFGVMFAIQALLIIVFFLYLCTPMILLENTLVYYSELDEPDDM
jgi:hypothetical protein